MLLTSVFLKTVSHKRIRRKSFLRKLLKVTKRVDNIIQHFFSNYCFIRINTVFQIHRNRKLKNTKTFYQQCEDIGKVKGIKRKIYRTWQTFFLLKNRKTFF